MTRHYFEDAIAKLFRPYVLHLTPPGTTAEERQRELRRLAGQQQGPTEQPSTNNSGNGHSLPQPLYGGTPHVFALIKTI
jgi:hypothetical protein